MVHSSAAMKNQKRSVVMAYALASASVMMAVIAIGDVPIVYPDSAVGLASLAAATVLYALATALLFVAVSLIGPLGFAVIDNTVPVWAILFGFLIFGKIHLSSRFVTIANPVILLNFHT